jgi:plastocyanin
MRHRIIIAGCSAIAASALAVGPAVGAAGHTVVLKNIAFTPKTLKVSKGTRVTWSWKDGDTPHNVTSVGKLKFTSSKTKTSGTYAITFRKAGTYRYECTIHPGMTARIVVR